MSLDSKRSLSPAKRWLVQRMQQIGYGTLYDLPVRDGEPIISPPPKIKQLFKLGSKRSPKLCSRDAALKQQHIELFDLMEEKRNGRITKLVIEDGLPFSVEWEDD
jgi:hypothetical protein